MKKLSRIILCVIAILVVASVPLVTGSAKTTDNEETTLATTEVKTTETTTEVTTELETEETTEVEITSTTQVSTTQKEVTTKETTSKKKENTTKTAPTENTTEGTGNWKQFTATAYCSCSICCGQWSGGPTASGTYPRAGRTIAVDTSVIPLGTTVEIKGMGTYVAEDTGSAINGNKIDIYFGSHSDALNFGRRTIYVRW